MLRTPTRRAVVSVLLAAGILTLPALALAATAGPGTGGPIASAGQWLWNIIGDVLDYLVTPILVLVWIVEIFGLIKQRGAAILMFVPLLLLSFAIYRIPDIVAWIAAS